MSNLPARASMVSFAREMIEYQNDQFGSQIEAIIESIRKDIEEDKYDSRKVPQEKQLIDLIFKRLGMKISITNDQALAAVIPFYSNKNHIFLPKTWRGEISVADQNRHLKESLDKKGTVDLKNAKLGGFFSTYLVTVFMNWEEIFISSNLTAPEASAVLLHELGHAFHICEYADRFASVNQVLASIALDMSNGKELTTSMVYREISRVNPKVTEAQVDEVINGNRVILGVRLFNLAVAEIGEQMKNDAYDRTSFEMLADSFASRFGYGRQIVTALEKIGKLYGDTAHSSTRTRFLVNLALLSVPLIITAYFVILASAATIVPAVIFYVFMNMFLSWTMGEDFKDYTYDDTKERYLRVRAQIVNQMKNEKLPKDIAKQLLADLQHIDAIVKETADFRTIFNVIGSFIFPRHRKARESVKNQQLQEILASSDLFVQATKLKTLA